MKTSGRILVIPAETDLNKLLLSYSRTTKELYNSLLMYILGSQIDNYQNLNLTKLTDYAIKLRSYKALDPLIAKYTLAYILYQIDQLKDINEVQLEFKRSMPIKYFSFILPHEKLQYDNKSSCYIGNIAANTNIYILHKQYKSKCVAYIIPFITQDGTITFSVELTEHHSYLKKYISLIEKLLSSSVADTTIVITPGEKPFNEFNILSIDIGSRNFASCISTSTFEPFVINADHIFTLHKSYIQKLNNSNMNLNTSKISNINKKLKKAMKFFISKCTQYLIKYCINNDICDVVVGITGNRHTDSDYLDNMLISEFNFAPLLQSLFRSELQTKCVKNGLKFYEVNEYKTSSTCCRCGYYDKKNRNRTTNIFTCRKCNLIIHGDINAAINILKRYCKNYFEPETFRDNLYTYIDKTIDYESMSTVKNILVLKTLPKKFLI